MTVTLAALILASLSASPGAAGAARPVSIRIAWLQDRVGWHRYVCHRGAHATRTFHCQALRWSSRELRQARSERYYRLPATSDWGVAVRLAQRVFPGTARWLLSCSASEGGHGAWKPYRAYGRAYYAGYERTDSVGGWMQFRPSTFRPYYRVTVAYVRAHGFRVRLSVDDWLSGWRDPLAQALTAGYMRVVMGNSGWHWAASIDRGCA